TSRLRPRPGQLGTSASSSGPTGVMISDVFCKDYPVLCIQRSTLLQGWLLFPSATLQHPISDPQARKQYPATSSMPPSAFRVPSHWPAPFQALSHPSSLTGCKPVITITKPTSNSYDVTSLDRSQLSLPGP
ncbi:mCG145322, partial [Mus musculus]